MTDISKETVERLIHVIADLGREVYWMLDDCETSGPVGNETHTITGHGLKAVSDVLDIVDELPFEEEGCVLLPGAKLRAGLEQVFRAQQARIEELEADLAECRASKEMAVEVKPHEIERQVWEAMTWAAYAGLPPSGVIPTYDERGNSDGETEARRTAERILSSITARPASEVRADARNKALEGAAKIASAFRDGSGLQGRKCIPDQITDAIRAALLTGEDGE